MKLDVSRITEKEAEMNYKLEKFWNPFSVTLLTLYVAMNYKLEKFWNNKKLYVSEDLGIWTINLKSFEIN